MTSRDYSIHILTLFEEKNVVASQWARNIVATLVFLLDIHRDIDRLRIEIEVTTLFDIFFQHHIDVVATT